MKDHVVPIGKYEKLLQWLILICWLVWAIFYALEKTVSLPTGHLDGAFQTASGLYRLHAGQFPGKDFYPYLGIGPIFLLYPVFLAFGANMAGSIVATHLAVTMVSILSMAIIYQLIWQPRSFLRSLSVAIFLFFIMLACLTTVRLFGFKCPPWINYSYIPGNSLKPIRSIAPYLVVFFYYFFITKLDSNLKKSFFGGILTGAILLWSNDFAIPSAGCLILLLGFDLWKNGNGKWQSIFLYVSVTSVFWAVLFIAVTAGQPLALLKYNFLDVGQDQWWFFAPYSESQRIFTPLQILRLMSGESYVPSFALLALFIVLLKTKSLEYLLLFWIGVVLFAGGALASIGGHVSGYFVGFYMWGTITLLFGLARLVWLNKPKLKLISLLWFTRAFVALLVATNLAAIYSCKEYYSTLSAARRNPSLFYIPELGGFLGADWKGYIALARATDNKNVFEEYWGIWSAVRKQFSNWPVDSVIHALGKTRNVATEKLQSAEIIITTRNVVSPDWQPWNLSQNYWFYRPLTSNWEPIYKSPTTVVWKKTGHANTHEIIPSKFVNKPLPVLIIDASKIGFYEIEMEYIFAGKGRFLVMIKNNLSYPMDEDGYVSLDPKGNHITFPVFLEKEGINILDLKIIGNSSNLFTIKRSQVTNMVVSDSDTFVPPRRLEN